MTGHELVGQFYYPNLSYLENHRPVDHPDYTSLVLFLVGLIETAYIISNPPNVHPDVVEFLNVN